MAFKKSCGNTIKFVKSNIPNAIIQVSTIYTWIIQNNDFTNTTQPTYPTGLHNRSLLFRNSNPDGAKF